jgi:ubiquinone/menaquinone biosynthesis C-methylase UbiE
MTHLKDPEGTEGKILHRFADFEDKRVLEVGCGEGRLTWKYASASSVTVGLDPDPDALRVARADAPHDLRPSTHFICADARSIPFAGETFDIALLAWSL